MKDAIHSIMRVCVYSALSVITTHYNTRLTSHKRPTEGEGVAPEEQIRRVDRRDRPDLNPDEQGLFSLCENQGESRMNFVHWFRLTR